LHDCSSTNDGHATPPLADCTVTLRVWRCLPPPHVAEHADHADQPLTTQLTGHACVLHGCEANKVGHRVPPWADAVTMLRDCVCTPVPQGFEQADHADHALTTQLRGHGCWLQACDSVKAGHMTPPLAACTVMGRARVWRPPLQVAEHADHADQAPTTQLTAQAAELHACEATGLAPREAWQFASWPSEQVTERVWTPPPHDLEHTDQAPVSQFGHARVLHDWVCVKTGHGMPPLAAATVTVRVDVCLPPPHWAEHTDHADQPLTTQLRGHACVLHG